MSSGVFSSQQASLLERAQFLFVLNQVIMFPLYYVLPYVLNVERLLDGDGKREVRFPCSISWMSRKGAPRLSTLLLWNWGWSLMLRAALKDGEIGSMSSAEAWRAAFFLQMYATGFVAVVLTPMRGPDVALGSQDKLHCYAAMLYVRPRMATHPPPSALSCTRKSAKPSRLSFLRDRCSTTSSPTSLCWACHCRVRTASASP